MNNATPCTEERDTAMAPVDPELARFELDLQERGEWRARVARLAALLEEPTVLS